MIQPGRRGPTGRDGQTGAAGADGAVGKDGRDAVRSSERLLPIAVVILALLMGGQYVYLLSGVRQRAECESNERGRIGALSDENQNRLILGVAQLMADDPDKKRTKAQERAEEVRYRGLFATFATEAERIGALRRNLAEGKVCG